MPVINIISNIGEVTSEMKERLGVLSDPEKLLRPIAFDIIDMMTARIHLEGRASDGGAIGTYSDDYLALRQRKYKRSGDTKVIVSLTRQLENDWSVIATEDNGYGIGFKNSHNYDKMRWVEQMKGKAIANLSPDEVTEVETMVAEAIEKILNGEQSD